MYGDDEPETELQNDEKQSNQEIKKQKTGNESSSEYTYGSEEEEEESEDEANKENKNASLNELVKEVSTEASGSEKASKLTDAQILAKI